jgi:hypothetical protein
MSEDLSKLHGELLVLIDELETMTAEMKPDWQRLTRLRWQLSRLSWLRQKLLEDFIFPHLIKRAAPVELENISRLRDINTDALAASRRHVAFWTIERTLADWAGYRKGSLEMREVMRDRISLEKAVLYPLIDRYGLS